MSVRTRFAPSPTGYLHIGGARVALFCWLYARKYQGEFILRIEDTDRERSTEESVRAILDGMEWLGLDYDEGPYYQTERMQRYQEVIDQLLADGNAYRCYCSKERLAQLREQQTAEKIKPRYDGHCRDKESADTEQAHVIRFRNPQEGCVQFSDKVYGDISVNNSELDDLIIARSDGTPTYNLTVVVDDWDMDITHVIRGDDHINNTPRQINILAALGAEIPLYAHLPMILGEDGKRLSKRHGAASVLEYRQAGMLPQAVLNYLVRLGWSHGDQEIFSQQEMIALFDLDEVNKAAGALNHDKLLWLNHHYIKNQKRTEVIEALAWQFAQASVDVSTGPSLESLIEVQEERCKTMAEMVTKSRYFYQDVTEYDEKAAQKNLKVSILEPLQTVKRQLAALEDWQEPAIHQVIVQTAEQCDVKLGKIAQPIRVAVTGNTVSPSIDVTLRLLGKDLVIKRLEQAITWIQSQNSA